MNELLSRLEKSKAFWFVLITAVVFFLLRLPSLIEPYWYGDEGVYETIGLALNKGRMLYTHIWDNKPPLLYLTYALSHGNQETVRFLSLLFGLATVITFFFLARRIFAHRQQAAFLATGFFALFFGLPIIEGNIANAENFMLLPIILAALLIYEQTKSNEPRTKSYLFLAGLLLGIAFLFKIVAVFDFAAFLLFYIVMALPKNITRQTLSHALKRSFSQLGLFVLGFLLPFVLSLVYFLFHGALSAYLQAIFFSNVGYVGYKNAFFIPQGLLLFKLLLLLLVIIIIFKRRIAMSAPATFLTLWLAFALFNAFFSQRPYTHYLLVVLPSFSLLIGWLLFLRRKHLFPLIACVGIFVLLVVSFDHWSIKKTFAYYTNYLSFLTKHKSLSAYQAFFDRQVPADMAVVDYLDQQHVAPGDVFLWGNTPQIYALTGTLPPGRFTVAYHSTMNDKSLAQTKQAVEQAKPTYIVIFPGVSTYPYPLYNYRHKLSIQNIAIYERIF